MNTVISFGKHKNLKLNEVPDSYKYWLYITDFNHEQIPQLKQELENEIDDFKLGFGKTPEKTYLEAVANEDYVKFMRSIDGSKSLAVQSFQKYLKN